VSSRICNSIYATGPHGRQERGGVVCADISERPVIASDRSPRESRTTACRRCRPGNLRWSLQRSISEEKSHGASLARANSQAAARARGCSSARAQPRGLKRSLRGASRKRSLTRARATFDRTSRLLTLRSASHLLAAPCWHVHVRCIDMLRRLVRRCERGIIAVSSSFHRIADIGHLDARGRSRTLADAPDASNALAPERQHPRRNREKNEERRTKAHEGHAPARRTLRDDGVTTGVVSWHTRRKRERRGTPHRGQTWTFSAPPRTSRHARDIFAPRAFVRACVRAYCPSLFSTFPDDGGRERKIDRADDPSSFACLDSRKAADHTLRPIVTLCRSTDQSASSFRT